MILLKGSGPRNDPYGTYTTTHTQKKDPHNKGREIFCRPSNNGTSLCNQQFVCRFSF